MKKLLTVLLWLIGSLIFFHLLMMSMAIASGHKIPESTKMVFYRNLIVLTVFGIIVFWGRKRINR